MASLRRETMAATKEGISKAIDALKSATPKRNFIQSIDLAIALKDVDLSKSENRISEELLLPHGRGKQRRVGVIAEGELAHQAAKIADRVITKAELEELAKDKKAAKKVVESVDFFVAQADLMPLIGRTLGPILGPRGKMPKPVPANAQIAPLLERLRRTVRVRTKEAPLLHIPVGTEEMDEKALRENIEAALHFVERKLERGFNNIRSVSLKMTMGPSQRLEV
jgi:large subunit ribosomal protein L1